MLLWVGSFVYLKYNSYSLDLESFSVATHYTSGNGFATDYVFKEEMYMKQEKLKALIRCVLCFVLAAAGMFLLMGLLSVVATISKNEFLLLALSGEQQDAVKGALSKLILSVSQYTPFIAVSILMATKAWKYKISDIGLTPIKKNWKDFVVGLLVGTVGISIAFLFLILSESIELTGWSFQYLDCVAITFVAYILVGFGEEIFFRGVIMLSLKPLGSKRLVAIVTAALFAVMHLGNNGVTVLAVGNLFVFGLFAAFCYICSGNIWLPIGFHITWNFVQGNIYGFHVSGNADYSLISHKVLNENLFTGGAFGPEGGLGVTIALVLCFTFAVWYYRNEEGGTCAER